MRLAPSQSPTGSLGWEAKVGRASLKCPVCPAVLGKGAVGAVPFLGWPWPPWGPGTEQLMLKPILYSAALLGGGALGPEAAFLHLHCLSVLPQYSHLGVSRGQVVVGSPPPGLGQQTPSWLFSGTSFELGPASPTSLSPYFVAPSSSCSLSVPTISQGPAPSCFGQLLPGGVLPGCRFLSRPPAGQLHCGPGFPLAGLGPPWLLLAVVCAAPCWMSEPGLTAAAALPVAHPSVGGSCPGGCHAAAH